MDDYFAEADEHLVSIRRNLLTLEEAPAGSLPRTAVEEFFRSVHSLKGISAMVELREAELLAHEMESTLREVRDGTLSLSTAGFETLTDATNALEQIVLAARERGPVPPIEPHVEALALLTSLKAPAGRKPVHPDTSVRQPSGSARGVWKVTFVPSAALVERGVKVDTIRARLLEIGHILSVAPKVVSGGGVSFEFHVRTDQDAQLAEWQADGLTYEPLVGNGTGADLQETGKSLPVDRPATTTAQLKAPGSSANLVRVDLSRLDDLMRLIGELVATRAKLDDRLQRVESYLPSHEWRALQEHSTAIERQVRDLREGVMRLRLIPVGEIFKRMPFVVRDLSRDTGKRVQLDLIGHDTEIDKFLIERMMDPILHIVRNAISHGLETPARRLEAGKSPEGTIRLRASTTGESVILEISDDGAGIDTEAVAARVRASGVQVPDGVLDASQLLDIICGAGFSTRDKADLASGRGMGMAVVHDTVHELGGTLDLETEAGRGTTFRITLPLTLAITDAIIAHVGAETFAIPQSSVREVIEVEPAALRSMERNELLPFRGGVLPVVRLSELFGISVEPRSRLYAIVVGAGLGAVALVVDRIAGQREIVVKTIVDPLIRVVGVSGATELGDGRLVLILDVADLSRILRERPTVMGDGA